MERKKIHGVEQKKLTVIPDERGRLMEILRNDEPLFKKFGQCYMTTAYPGVVKGWHFHKLQWDHFVCLRGMIKLVLYDRREDSPTQGMVNEFFIGENNHSVVSIPPGVLHGFKCVSDLEAMILNLPTEPYQYVNPDEYRVSPHGSEVPYDWARKDG